METVETIESGQRRARIVVDTDPQEPYGDALAPVFRLAARRVAFDIVSDYRPTDLMPGDVMDALERFDVDYDKVDRYLRMFHGVTAVEWITPPTSSDTYVIFDTPDWRKLVGLPTDTHNTEGAVKATAQEWQAWLEGEVYGVIVEYHRRGVTFWRDGKFERVEEWYEDHAVYGYYGMEAAQQAAQEALA